MKINAISKLFLTRLFIDFHNHSKSKKIGKINFPVNISKKKSLLRSKTLTIVSICNIFAKIFSLLIKFINASVSSSLNISPIGLIFPNAQHKTSLGTFQNCLGSFRIRLRSMKTRVPISINETFEENKLCYFSYVTVLFESKYLY